MKRAIKKYGWNNIAQIILFENLMKDVHEYDIEKRLCSKDFWRKYSELAAEKIVKGYNA